MLRYALARGCGPDGVLAGVLAADALVYAGFSAGFVRAVAELGEGSELV